MKQSAELREHILSLVNRSTETADQTPFSQFSQEEGVLAIGTDPNEWLAGFEALSKVSGTESDLAFVGCNPQAYSEGNVGWAADQCNGAGRAKYF